MPDVAQVLKAEIRRVARSEFKAQMATVKAQIKLLKKTVRMQRETIAQLQKTTSQGNQRHRSDDVEDAKEGTSARITPASIKRHRQRLKLSQRELGKLMRVSTNTIVRWEAGTSAPRARHKGNLAEMRGLGRREVVKLLEKA
tara:strand:+ start:1977 stop:2402 length:426 start_codon:yes stop_codon:yes gene_type:complete